MEGKGNKLVFQQNATKYVAEQVTEAEIPRRPQETVSASPQDSASQTCLEAGAPLRSTPRLPGRPVLPAPPQFSLTAANTGRGRGGLREEGK